jgi:Tfp pilus assembly protein FimT
MSEAAPPRPAERRPARRLAVGFTLLEILLALTLIGMVAAVLIGGSVHLLTDKPLTPHESFWNAVQQSRKTALTLEREVRLRFDGEKKQFLILDGVASGELAADGVTREEVPLKVLPVPATADSDLVVEFLAATSGGNAILVGGVMLESQPIAYVTFYPDGTCTAFRAQFVRNGVADIFGIDPWTCAPMLTAKQENSAF